MPLIIWESLARDNTKSKLINELNRADAYKNTRIEWRKERMRQKKKTHHQTELKLNKHIFWQSGAQYTIKVCVKSMRCIGIRIDYRSAISCYGWSICVPTQSLNVFVVQWKWPDMGLCWPLLNVVVHKNMVASLFLVWLFFTLYTFVAIVRSDRFKYWSPSLCLRTSNATTVICVW